MRYEPLALASGLPIRERTGTTSLRIVTLPNRDQRLSDSQEPLAQNARRRKQRPQFARPQQPDVPQKMFDIEVSPVRRRPRQNAPHSAAPRYRALPRFRQPVKEW